MGRQPALRAGTRTVATPEHLHRGLLTAALLVVSSLCWIRTFRDGSDMGPMGFALPAFLIGWAAMMAAMMLPAVAPAVLLYSRAAAAGRVAPSGFFVSGYLLVWVLSGLPAGLLWWRLADSLMMATPWALRLSAAVLLLAGGYQLTPVKRACLRHCRSPMGVLLRSGRPLGRPVNAVRAGITHGTHCLGCCVGLMVVLVLAAAMQPVWAAVVAVAVFAERNLPHGEAIAQLFAAALVALGAIALISPAFAEGLVQGGL
jgi:predicted metal-binding membrane protein